MELGTAERGAAERDFAEPGAGGLDAVVVPSSELRAQTYTEREGAGE